MTDWAEYLAGFHSRHPGITEEVLGRSRSGDLTPYRWLARAVSGSHVLDLAGGNGALAQALQDIPARGAAARVVVVDLSLAELRAGLARGRTHAAVCADAVRLPFAGARFDAVACSAGLMVLTDLDAALVEVARVLRPGGILAATVPSAAPLRAQDLRLLAPLTARLRTTPQFPAGGELSGLASSLEAAGLTVLEDARERFGYVVHTADDARLLVRSLYLPDTPERRRERAAGWLAERAAAAGEDGVEVAVPVRRVIAMRA